MKNLTTSLILLFFSNSILAESELAGLEELTGHCWQATFPDGKKIDTHCFSKVYGGKHIKDEHVVCGGDEPYYGETWYSADKTSQQVTFRYFNSLGGYSEGDVNFDNSLINFPQETYQQGEEKVVYKTTWTLDKDQYISNMSQKTDNSDSGWKPIWNMTFKKVKLTDQSLVARNKKNQLHCH